MPYDLWMSSKKKTWKKKRKVKLLSDKKNHFEMAYFFNRKYHKNTSDNDIVVNKKNRSAFTKELSAVIY